MAISGLKKMRDPKIAISDWLTSQDGKYSLGNNAEAHRLTVGAHTTNDRVESNFGGYDAVLRIFENISVEAAAGLAQQMRMHHFDSCERHGLSDRRKAKAAQETQADGGSTGFMYALSEEVQEAGVEAARQLRAEARRWERADRKEQAEYRAMKREQNLQLQLEALAEKGAIAQERFDAYEARAVSTHAMAKQQVAGLPSATARVAYLREQIELRVLGFGWSDLACKWGEDSELVEAKAARLLGHLKDVLVEERVRRQNGEIPTEPPMPEFRAKELKQLGTPTADALELAKRALCSPEQLKAATERERERRQQAGFADEVQAVQQYDAPELDGQLVGARLEICWHYTSTEDNKTKVPIWCPCKVVRIADGETDKGSNNKAFSDHARAIAPRGMMLVEWEADPDRNEPVTTVWYLLDPRKWNADRTHRAWRFHPEELAKRKREQQQAAAAAGCGCE